MKGFRVCESLKCMQESTHGPPTVELKALFKSEQYKYFANRTVRKWFCFRLGGRCTGRTLSSRLKLPAAHLNVYTVLRASGWGTCRWSEGGRCRRMWQGACKQENRGVQRTKVVGIRCGCSQAKMQSRPDRMSVGRLFRRLACLVCLMMNLQQQVTSVTTV